MELQSTEIAYAACRVILGVLFVAQAYDKIFRLGLNQVTDTFAQAFSSVPRPLVYLTVFFTSWIELICGSLLIPGLFTDVSMWLLALDMMIVAVGFSFIKPMWDMQHYFPRVVLLLILLILPEVYNTFSLDFLIR